MKKLFTLAIIALATGTTAFAAPNSIVSAKVNANFTASFSSAKNVSWKSNPGFDKVSFVLNNEKVDAFYDANGDLIGTSKSIAFDKLPKAALATITTLYTYPDYQVQDCIEFVNSDGDKNFYVSMHKKNENVILEITEGGSVSIFAKNRK